MCIRDSNGHHVFGPIRQRGRQESRLSEASASLVLSADLGPVSYTHLRAHETVLDLVCRLLLEKKNYHQH